MVNACERHLVVGCGERGLKWEPDSFSNTITVRLDCQERKNSPETYVVGNSLFLPFADKSINAIWADFVLNAASIPSVELRVAVETPQIFAKGVWPLEVKEWYAANLAHYEYGVPNSLVPKKMEELRWVLRTVMFAEFLRVTREEGNITIIDHKHVVDTLLRHHKDILHKTVDVRFPFITANDCKRSASLERLLASGAKVKKVVLHKKPVQLSLPSLEEIYNGRASWY